MDYSSLPNDPDNPAGSSPWQSSPQPTSRPSFTASEADSTPSSPLAKHAPYTADSPQGTEGESSDLDTHDERNTDENPQPGTTRARLNGGRQDSSSYSQGPPLMQQLPQAQPQQHARQPQSQQQRTGPNRYHGGANRTVPRQNLPQYKLQAKITSLERTGRKDPVLRFDVHVSFIYPIPPNRSPLTLFIDQSSQISYDPISGRSTNAFRILQTRRPPNIVQPRSVRTSSPSTINSGRGRYGRG